MPENNLGKEQDFRQRLASIENMMAPFPEAVALAIQHAGWSGQHELGSVIQRALTATSIRAKANDKDSVAQLTIVRQKNDEEGRTFTFQKHSLGRKGRIVMIPATISKQKAASLVGDSRIAYDALVRVIDDGNQAGNTLPRVSERLSARCPVHLWRAEYERMKSEGADTKADTIARTFRRAKKNLQSVGVVGFYDNLAWIIWEAPDKPDMAADN